VFDLPNKQTKATGTCYIALPGTLALRNLRRVSCFVLFLSGKWERSLLK
jgi:hypothetical protein